MHINVYIKIHINVYIRIHINVYIKIHINVYVKHAGQYIYISCQWYGNSLPNSIERNSSPGTNIPSCGQAISLLIQEKRRPLAPAQVSSNCFYSDPHMYSLHHLYIYG